MKYFSKARHMLLLISAITTLSLLGCSGCAPQENIQSNLELKEIEWNLSANAQSTFAYLLYDQALRNEDEYLVLVALQELKSSNMPVALYIESSIWLMSRRSPNTLAALELGLELYPNNISLVLLYAENLQDNGQSGAAIEFMQQYLEKNEESVDAKLEIALLFIKTEKYKEAQLKLRSIPNLLRTPLVNYYMARTYIGLDEPDKAINFLKMAIKKSPSFIEAMAELAYIYEKKQRIADASILYAKMLKLNEGNQEVLLRLISLYLKQDDNAKVVEFINKGPTTDEFVVLVATLLIEYKKFDAAENLLFPLTKKDNYPAEVNFYLAAISYEKNSGIEIAFKWLEKIPLGNDFHKKSVLLKIQMLANDLKLNEALSITQNAKADYPEHNDLWQLEIRLLAQLDRQKDALDITNIALERWPQSTELIFLQGSLFDELGDKINALNSMEALISVNPNHYQALNYVGYTLAEDSKDLPRAISLLQRAIALSPNSSHIIDSLAWAQFKAGKLQEAWENINKAVTLIGISDPTMWEHYGDIANALGHSSEANKGYIKALKLTPQDLENARKRLEKKIK